MAHFLLGFVVKSLVPMKLTSVLGVYLCAPQSCPLTCLSAQSWVPGIAIPAALYVSLGRWSWFLIFILAMPQPSLHAYFYTYILGYIFSSVIKILFVPFIAIIIDEFRNIWNRYVLSVFNQERSIYLVFKNFISFTLDFSS